jgi:hypothetical protein
MSTRAARKLVAERSRAVLLAPFALLSLFGFAHCARHTDVDSGRTFAACRF